MKRNVIVTCSNEKYGDFLVNHWLRSLKENVNLDNTDVVVIDYGLNLRQLNLLQQNNALIIRGSGSGHVVNLRFVDAGKFLKKQNYHQVLFVDGGDIIFQSDISDLFNRDRDSYRVVKLGLEVLYFETFIPRTFSGPFKDRLWRVLAGKPVLNAGLIFAPKDKFVTLCDQVAKLVTKKDKYGPDQVIVNYVLYQNKIKLLDKKYNFMLGCENEGFKIKNGIFFKNNGEKIAVVHNAGHDSLLRPVGNFGFGLGYNHLKLSIYYGRKCLFGLFGLGKRLQRH